MPVERGQGILRDSPHKFWKFYTDCMKHALQPRAVSQYFHEKNFPMKVIDTQNMSVIRSLRMPRGSPRIFAISTDCILVMCDVFQPRVVSQFHEEFCSKGRRTLNDFCEMKKCEISIACTAIESTTFALLARRSNQLTASLLFARWR